MVTIVENYTLTHEATILYGLRRHVPGTTESARVSGKAR